MSCPSGVMDGDPGSGLQDRAAMGPGGVQPHAPARKIAKSFLWALLH